jgi:hypothetical protein
MLHLLCLQLLLLLLLLALLHLQRVQLLLQPCLEAAALAC